jgi:hypothetical protein
MPDAGSAPSDQDTNLRKRLLSVILRHTLRGAGIPAKWISGETNTITTTGGRVLIELALEVTCDEPRLYAYLSALQAEVIRRLTAFEGAASEWFGGITWRLTNEAVFEVALPSADYWDEVDRDRAVTARLHRAADWDKSALDSHFRETQPGDLLVGFAGKKNTRREIEDVITCRAHTHT